MYFSYLQGKRSTKEEKRLQGIGWLFSIHSHAVANVFPGGHSGLLSLLQRQSKVRSGQWHNGTNSTISGRCQLIALDLSYIQRLPFQASGGGGYGVFAVQQPGTYPVAPPPPGAASGYPVAPPTTTISTANATDAW